ncbi:beta-N-acetylglucosaminidase [Exophiala viscosa]|uniref:beta-N-acetylglucosaminidase n=1 Tax=Exophiala viscosa TaxID=2486360 RepID=UPI00219D828C|nr:beta-N-acetylglucosaminidase [Exophiala viscosa]
MAVAATGSLEIASDVARATALEITTVGVNLILGPVLDVLTNARSQPLGARTTGDDPQEVSRYGTAYISGYKSTGIATCGKHFPSYGNLQFLGGGQDIPVITDTLEQLSSNALLPFRNAIANGIDAVMVGGCALVSSGAHMMHACLSREVVTALLREDLDFNGVVLSACLEMESLIRHIGVGGGTVMAIDAGCDIVVLCRSYEVQQDAIAGLKLGVENGMLSKDRIYNSLKRVLKMKSRCTSWEKALEPIGLDVLSALRLSHSALSKMAYRRSITLLRDKSHLIPLTDLSLGPNEVLLLSPLLKPLHASAVKGEGLAGSMGVCSDDVFQSSTAIMQGEETFTDFGRRLGHRLKCKVLHTSYTAHGLCSVHENLISRAGAVIVLTADAHRNHYQSGFTKHVAMICNSQFCASNERREKPLIVVSVSSPYDFAVERSIGTHLCTYDFTRPALDSLVDILTGVCTPEGTLPGTGRKKRHHAKSAHYWLVEEWSRERDEKALNNLIRAVVEGMPSHRRSALVGSTTDSFLVCRTGIGEAHFVVRNSSTGALYGFCSTYFLADSGTGVIGALFVDPTRRDQSIGNSLHERAKRALLGRSNLKSIQLGSGFPTTFLGLPADDPGERQRLRAWFGKRGYDISASHLVCRMILRNLSSRSPEAEIIEVLRESMIGYDTVSDPGDANIVMDFVQKHSSRGEAELYKIATADRKAYPIIRARDLNDGSILGCTILCDGRSLLAQYLPVLRDSTEVSGGLLSLLTRPAATDANTVLQGLVLYGIQRIKAQGLRTCVLDMVSGESSVEAALAIGFTVMHSFEGGVQLKL